MKLKIRENLRTASLNPKFTGSCKTLILIKMKDELSRSRLYGVRPSEEDRAQKAGIAITSHRTLFFPKASHQIIASKHVKNPHPLSHHRI